MIGKAGSSMIALRPGSVVRLRSGTDRWVTVVLLANKHEKWWDCKVVASHPTSAYQVGGYDISAHADDLRAGVEITRFLGDGE